MGLSMGEDPLVSVAKIRSTAMDILTGREYSRHELAQKLQRKFAGHHSIDSVLKELVAEGLQSDRRYTEAFIRSRKMRGQGPLRIASDIRQKGVDRDLLASVMEEMAIDWYSVVDEVNRRKYGPKGPLDRADKARRMRFLQSRGFNFEQVVAAVQGSSED
jgi:regulatory protein